MKFRVEWNHGMSWRAKRLSTFLETLYSNWAMGLFPFPVGQHFSLRHGLHSASYPVGAGVLSSGGGVGEYSPLHNAEVLMRGAAPPCRHKSDAPGRTWSYFYHDIRQECSVDNRLVKGQESNPGGLKQGYWSCPPAACSISRQASGDLPQHALCVATDRHRVRVPWFYSSLLTAAKMQIHTFFFLNNKYEMIQSDSKFPVHTHAPGDKRNVYVTWPVTLTNTCCNRK
jgi:hypothetical protein